MNGRRARLIRWQAEELSRNFRGWPVKSIARRMRRVYTRTRRYGTR